MVCGICWRSRQVALASVCFFFLRLLMKANGFGIPVAHCTCTRNAHCGIKRTEENIDQAGAINVPRGEARSIPAMALLDEEQRVQIQYWRRLLLTEAHSHHSRWLKGQLSP